MLLEFAQTPRAVASAFELQRRVVRWNQARDEDRCIRLRIGLHVADVVEDGLDVYGVGVNLAARIAGIARPGGVAASVEAVDELLPGVDALLEDGGLCYLKHLDEPVQVYHLAPAVEMRGSAGPELKPKPAIVKPPLVEPALATCIALVPIVASSDDADQGTLAELVSDILLTRLSTVPLLRVVSRLSTEQFRLRGFDVRGIARHTGAAYLVTGRLHGRGRQSLLFLELIDAESEDILWADSVRLDEGSLLVHDEAVTPHVAQSLVDRIVAHQLRRVQISPLPNLASQSLQFSAIHLMHRRALADFGRAHEILEHLVDRHPRAAAPHAWLAKWHVLRVNKGWMPETATESARALAHTRRALDLDPDSAMAMAMEAFVHCHMLHDLACAQLGLNDALEINPNEPWAWLVSATVNSLLGQGEDAWQCALRARELSPMDPLKHYYDSLAASAAVAAERYTEAERLARLSLSKDARHLPTLRALAIAQVHLGQITEARATIGKVLLMQPDFNLTHYISSAPRGGEAMRQRWAVALREAGAPEH